MTLDELRALHASDPEKYFDPDVYVNLHNANDKPQDWFNCYGTTIPQQWYNLLMLASGVVDVKFHTMMKNAIEGIASPEQQLEMANKEGVTRSEIVRRLIVQAFPWLPTWNWPKRSAMKNTPKAPSVKKAKEEMDATILQRAETESRQVYAPDVFAKLKAKALAHPDSLSVDEYIKRLITKHAEK